MQIEFVPEPSGTAFHFFISGEVTETEHSINTCSYGGDMDDTDFILLLVECIKDLAKNSPEEIDIQHIIKNLK